jgi:hypothetical protein
MQQKAEQKVIKAMEMAEKGKLKVQNLASQLSSGNNNSSKTLVKKKQIITRKIA